MRRFRFRLGRVLALRRQLLRLERIRMASAQRALQRAQEQESAGDLRRAEHLATLGALGRRGTRPGGCVEGDARLEGRALAMGVVILAELTRRRAHWAAELCRAQAESERERQRLIDAHRAVRTLELFEARRRLAYRREVERDERLALDEAGALGYLRRRNGEA